MQPDFMVSFDWNPICVKANQIIDLMRKYRGKKLKVLFLLGEGVYEVGVNPENEREPFYMDQDTYPSMFAFVSSANVEGGYLLPDVAADVKVLSVNESNPAPFFQKAEV